MENKTHETNIIKNRVRMEQNKKKWEHATVLIIHLFFALRLESFGFSFEKSKKKFSSPPSPGNMYNNRMQFHSLELISMKLCSLMHTRVGCKNKHRNLWLPSDEAKMRMREDKNDVSARYARALTGIAMNLVT